MIRCPRCHAKYAEPVQECSVCGARFAQHLSSTPRIEDQQKKLVGKDLIGHTTAGRYKIETMIAQSRMGTVYRAWSEQHQRMVALKTPTIMSDESQLRFSREARALVSCQHNHIVKLLDLELDNDHRPYLVLEYIDAPNLRQHLQKQTLSQEECATIAHQLALVCFACMKSGVVHRDIKPENLLYQSGKLTLIDFGLALVDHYTNAEENKREERASYHLGTPPYSAPEQISHPSHVDHRADIFSSGRVLEDLISFSRWRDEQQYFGMKRLADHMMEQDLQNRCSIYEWIETCQIGKINFQGPISNSLTETTKIKPISRTIKQLIDNKYYFYALVISVLILFSSIIFTFIYNDDSQKGRIFDGHLRDEKSGQLEIKIGPQGSELIQPLGNTKIRLPGSGPYQSRPLLVHGNPNDKITIYFYDDDGYWELQLRN